ncbi:MAG: cytochrome b6-f complex iron-sulfur subunit [Frankiaceae bacterium]|jgi:Rieske Fe-S protein|nr:cytochrome b6-f complex iron-sulfur subunit [Frankiaceae bacterium]
MDAREIATGMLETTIGRRAAIVGVGAAGLAALAACSSSSTAAPAGAGGGTSAPPTGAATGASTDSGAAGGASLVALADLPVGGSVSANGADGKPILVSQPTAGKVVAFTAICTHMACTVKPAGQEFHCPCHGSIYDAATGAVKHGPAPKPLASVPVHVVNGQVVSG